MVWHFLRSSLRRPSKISCSLKTRRSGAVSLHKDCCQQLLQAKLLFNLMKTFLKESTLQQNDGTDSNCSLLFSSVKSQLFKAWSLHLNSTTYSIYIHIIFILLITDFILMPFSRQLVYISVKAIAFFKRHIIEAFHETRSLVRWLWTPSSRMFHSESTWEYQLLGCKLRPRQA